MVIAEATARRPLCEHEPQTHRVFFKGVPEPSGACAECAGWCHFWGILMNTKRQIVIRAEANDGTPF